MDNLISATALVMLLEHERYNSHRGCDAHPVEALLADRHHMCELRYVIGVSRGSMPCNLRSCLLSPLNPNPSPAVSGSAVGIVAQPCDFAVKGCHVDSDKAAHRSALLHQSVGNKIKPMKMSLKP